MSTLRSIYVPSVSPGLPLYPRIYVDAAVSDEKLKLPVLEMELFLELNLPCSVNRAT